MAKYDYHCSTCALTMEHTCPMAEREAQTCIQCGGAVEFLFSPPSVIRIPEAFRHSFSELFGTSSEKDYRKENPGLEVVSHSRTHKGEKQKKKEERDSIIKEGLEIEKTLLAQGNLKRPIKVEAGSTESDV